MMQLIAKKFDELTTTELYEMLKARSAIFIVEQNCVYQDLDDLDYRSLHVFYEEGKTVTAYLRAFYAVGYYEREGFKIVSEEFLEDGIPHVQMVLHLE
jgi:ElaA protein